VERLRERAAALGLAPELPASIPVLSFAELRADVLEGKPGAEADFAALANDLARRGLDLPEQCRALTDHLWMGSRRTGPAVVIGFASMPYPPTELRGEAGERLERAVRDAADAIASRSGSSVGVMRYFPGISDMSHLGQVDPEAFPAVAANTPAWGFGIPRSPGKGMRACLSSTPVPGAGTTIRRWNGSTRATPSTSCPSSCWRSSAACCEPGSRAAFMGGRFAACHFGRDSPSKAYRLWPDDLGRFAFAFVGARSDYQPKTRRTGRGGLLRLVHVQTTK
jgi:hypothetical protein